jgi:hypothetical protein
MQKKYNIVIKFLNSLEKPKKVKIEAPNLNIHDSSISGVGTGFSMKKWCVLTTCIWSCQVVLVIFHFIINSTLYNGEKNKDFKMSQEM